MITDRLFVFVGDLSSKAFAFVVSGTSLAFSAIIGEVLTNHVGLAALAGGIGTGLAACFLVVPRIMEQRRKSRESNAKLESALLSKMTYLHKSEIDFYKLQLASERLIITIERNAKHKAISEWGAAVNHYQILAAQLRANKLTPDITLPVKTYADLLGDSDKEIKEVNAARVAESPPVVYNPPG
jgi:hypothetical protein